MTPPPPAQGDAHPDQPPPHRGAHAAQGGEPYGGQVPPEYGGHDAGFAPQEGHAPPPPSGAHGSAYPGPVPPAHDPYAGQVPPMPGFAPPGSGEELYAFRPGDTTGGGGQAYGDAAAYDYGGEAYVPEPLGGQLPAQADPGAAFGVPSAGDAWGGGQDAAQAYRGPGAVDGWGQPPAPAPAWDAPQPSPQPSPHLSAAHSAWDAQSAAAEAPAPAWDAQHTAVMEPVPPGPPAGQAPAPAADPRRSGSPIIPPGIRPAALTAALGLLTAGAAAVGRPLLAVALVLLEGVTAAGWFRLNGMWPARQGIALAFLAGVTADVALLAASGGHNAEVLLGTLGGWLLLVLVLQLRHHGSADERLASLTATSASTLLTVLAASWLAAARSGAGTDPVVVGAVAVAAGTLLRAVRLPDAASVVLAVLAAAATGLATGPATGFGTGHAALLGAACGLCAVVGLRVASYDFPSRFVHFTAGVALPLTAAAPAVYLLGNAWS